MYRVGDRDWATRGGFSAVDVALCRRDSSGRGRDTAIGVAYVGLPVRVPYPSHAAQGSCTRLSNHGSLRHAVVSTDACDACGLDREFYTTVKMLCMVKWSYAQLGITESKGMGEDEGRAGMKSANRLKSELLEEPVEVLAPVMFAHLPSNRNSGFLFHMYIFLARPALTCRRICFRV